MNTKLGLFIVGALLLALLALGLSIQLLPTPPLYPTPTWPLGLNMPESLPRIPPR